MARIYFFLKLSFNSLLTQILEELQLSSYPFKMSTKFKAMGTKAMTIMSGLLLGYH